MADKLICWFDFPLFSFWSISSPHNPIALGHTRMSWTFLLLCVKNLSRLILNKRPEDILWKFRSVPKIHSRDYITVNSLFYWIWSSVIHNCFGSLGDLLVLNGNYYIINPASSVNSPWGMRLCWCHGRSFCLIVASFIQYSSQSVITSVYCFMRFIMINCIS